MPEPRTDWLGEATQLESSEPKKGENRKRNEGSTVVLIGNKKRLGLYGVSAIGMKLPFRFEKFARMEAIRGRAVCTTQAPPHNKRIELTAGGRHGHCLRNGRAGSARPLLFPRRGLAPSSQLIRALAGQATTPFP